MPEGDLVAKTTDASDLTFSPKFAPTSYDKPGEVMAVASPLSDIPEVRGHRSNIRVEAEVAKGSEAVIKSIGILKGALGQEFTVGEVSRLRETIIVEHPVDVIREHFAAVRNEMGTTKGSELINAELQTIKDRGLRDFITKIAVIELTESVDLRENRWKRLKRFVSEVRRHPIKALESLKPRRNRNLPSEKTEGKRKFNGEVRNIIKAAQLFHRLTIHEYSFSKLLQENDLGVALKMAKGVSKAASILDSDIRYGKKRSKTGRQEIEIINLAGKAFRAIKEIYVSRIVLEKEIAEVLEPKMKQIISDISVDFARELAKKNFVVDVDLMKDYLAGLLRREDKEDWIVNNKDGSRTPYRGTYVAVKTLALDLARNTGEGVNEDFVRRINATVEEYFTTMHRIESVEDALSRLPMIVKSSPDLNLLTIADTLSKGKEEIVKAGITTEIKDKKYPADLLATLNKAEKARNRIERVQKNLVKRTSKVQEMLIKDRFQKTSGGVVTAVSRIERSSGGELFSPLPTREVVEAELGTYTKEYLGSSKVIRALWGLSNKVLVRANTSVGTSLNSERFTYHLSSGSIRPLAIVGVCAMVGGLIFAHLNNERKQAEINDRIICLNAYGSTDYRYEVQSGRGLQLSTVEETIAMFNKYNPWLENFRKGDLTNVDLSPQRVADILVVNATPYIKKTYYPQPEEMVKGVSRAIILPLIESQKQRGEPTDKLTPRSQELYRSMMEEFAKNKNELLVKVLMGYYQNNKGEFILAPTASQATKNDIAKQLKARIELASLLGNINDQIKFTLEDMERVCK